MSVVNMHDAKTHLSKLVERIEAGQETEIVIARNGKPAARLVPIEPNRKGVRLGIAAGRYPDFDFEGFQALDTEVAKTFVSEDDDAPR